MKQKTRHYNVQLEVQNTFLTVRLFINILMNYENLYVFSIEM